MIVISVFELMVWVDGGNFISLGHISCLSVSMTSSIRTVSTESKISELYLQTMKVIADKILNLIKPLHLWKFPAWVIFLNSVFWTIVKVTWKAWENLDWQNVK